MELRTKAYKVLLDLREDQKPLMMSLAGANRWAYNHELASKFSYQRA